MFGAVVTFDARKSNRQSIRDVTENDRVIEKARSGQMYIFSTQQDCGLYSILTMSFCTFAIKQRNRDDSYVGMIRPSDMCA